MVQMRRSSSLMIIGILLAGYLPLQAVQQIPLLSSDAIVEDSEKAACEVLKTRFAELYMENKKPDRYWFCDFTTQKSNYVRIIGLRSSAPRNDGATIYSNLMGWFAVARRSHVVLQWDLNEDRLIPIDGSYSDRIVEDSDPAACDVLKSQIARILEANERPDPSWTCEPLKEKDQFVSLVALRSISGPTAPSTTGKLIGTFAVAKRSDLVIGFDVSGNRLVALKSKTAK